MQLPTDKTLDFAVYNEDLTQLQEGLRLAYQVIRGIRWCNTRAMAHSKWLPMDMGVSRCAVVVDLWDKARKYEEKAKLWSPNIVVSMMSQCDQ